MKNNREMIGLKHRDKSFNRIAWLVMLVPVAYYVYMCVQYAVNCYGAGPDTFYWIVEQMKYNPRSIYMDGMILRSGIMVLTLQVVRWVMCESADTKDANLTLPVSSKTRVGYDFKTGCKMLLVINVIYLAILLVMEFVDLGFGIKWSSEYYGYSVIEKYGFFTIVLEHFNLYTGFLSEVVGTILTTLLIYGLLVLGKYVSEKYTWACVFTFCAVVVLIFGEDWLWGLFYRLAATPVTLGAGQVMSALIMLAKVLLFIGCIVLSLRAAKERDEARHGAFYFQLPRWLVCVVAAVLAMIGGRAAIPAANPIATVIFNILIVVILGGGVLAGMLYVTAEKHG